LRFFVTIVVFVVDDVFSHFKKSTLWLMVYENSRENKLILFVSMEIVTIHEIKLCAAQMGSTNIFIAAKHMDIFYLITSH
jgi:hypothetical protein